jgi:hypothetical protein
VRLSQDFGSMDPHRWAIDGRLPGLRGPTGKFLFSSVGALWYVQGFDGNLRNNRIVAKLRSIATFGRVYRVYPKFGGDMGGRFNLQNPKRTNFYLRFLIPQ